MKKVLDIIKIEVASQATNKSEIDFSKIEKILKDVLNDVSITTAIIAVNMFEQFKIQTEEETRGYPETLKTCKKYSS
jgi:NTP pyrophosphatase (non-canonical NTP hydrolase)